MRTDLQGRHALVTGASSGIGRAVAERLLERGATVLVTGRRADRLDALKAEAAAGERLTAMAGDVDDDAFRRALVDRLPRVDILINAAGLLQHAPFLEGDPAAWERMWRTNVHSVMCLTQLAARRMVQQGSGHIVNI